MWIVCIPEEISKNIAGLLTAFVEPSTQAVVFDGADKISLAEPTRFIITFPTPSDSSLSLRLYEPRLFGLRSVWQPGSMASASASSLSALSIPSEHSKVPGREYGRGGGGSGGGSGGGGGSNGGGEVTMFFERKSSLVQPIGPGAVPPSYWTNHHQAPVSS